MQIMRNGSVQYQKTIKWQSEEGKGREDSEIFGHDVRLEMKIWE